MFAVFGNTRLYLHLKIATVAYTKSNCVCVCMCMCLCICVGLFSLIGSYKHYKIFLSIFLQNQILLFSFVILNFEQGIDELFML